MATGKGSLNIDMNIATCTVTGKGSLKIDTNILLQSIKMFYGGMCVHGKREKYGNLQRKVVILAKPRLQLVVALL